MWVRAVAAALAVWCASGAAMAAGYTEEWNPPEASGHAAGKLAKKKPAAVKAKPQTGAGLKPDPKHAAGGPHKAVRAASTTRHGGEKTAMRGGVQKVSSTGTKHGVRQAGVGVNANAGKARPKAAVMAQAKKPRTQPHTQLVHAKVAQGKVVRADLAHPARPHAVSVVAKSGAVKPAGAHLNANTPVASANFNGGSANASTNPATASSGSLPPIIH